MFREGKEMRAKTKRNDTGGRESRVRCGEEQEKGQPHGYRSCPSQVETDLCEAIQTGANLFYFSTELYSTCTGAGITASLRSTLSHTYTADPGSRLCGVKTLS